MKTFFYIGFLLEFALAGIGCSKKQATLPVNPIIKGRVVEFGTDLPLANAGFSYSRCTRAGFLGCDHYETTNITANPDGVLTVLLEDITDVGPDDLYVFQKNGYWQNTKNVNFLGNNTENLPEVILFISSGNAPDSFLVKLFPVVNVSVHVKNNNAAQTAATLNTLAFYSSTDIPRRANSLFLRSGIDTVFYYPAFGDVWNKIYVTKTTSPDTLYNNSRFIAKGDNLSLDIIY